MLTELNEHATHLFFLHAHETRTFSRGPQFHATAHRKSSFARRIHFGWASLFNAFRIFRLIYNNGHCEQQQQQWELRYPARHSRWAVDFIWCHWIAYGSEPECVVPFGCFAWNPISYSLDTVNCVFDTALNLPFWACYMQILYDSTVSIAYDVA